jgi:hypothetical protein
MVSDDTTERERYLQEVQEAFKHAEDELSQQPKSIAPGMWRKISLSCEEVSVLERYLATEGLSIKQSNKNLRCFLIKSTGI